MGREADQTGVLGRAGLRLQQMLDLVGSGQKLAATKEESEEEMAEG